MSRARTKANVYDSMSQLQYPRKEKVRSRRWTRPIFLPRLFPTKRTQPILTYLALVQLCKTVPTRFLTRPTDRRTLLPPVEEGEDGDGEGEEEEDVGEDVVGADQLDVSRWQLRTPLNVPLFGDNHLEQRIGRKCPILLSRWTLTLDTYIHTSLIFVDSKDITSSKRASHRSDMA